MHKKIPFTELALFLLILSPTYAANLSFVFTSPTPADKFLTNASRAEINSTIYGKDIREIIFNLNENDYRLYGPSLILAMNFDEASLSAEDTSKYGNNGTLQGAVWTGKGRYNGAVEFAGGNSYVNIDYGSSIPIALNYSRDYTIAMWVKPENCSVNGTRNIISFRSRLGDSTGIDLGGTCLAYLKTRNSTSSATSNGKQMNESEWGFLTGIYSSSDKNLAFCLNAVCAEPVKAVEWNYNRGFLLTLGGNRIIGGNPYWFSGLIDEVRIYNRSLSQEEIKLLYQSNLRKINDTAWEFYASMTNLTDGDYSYYIWAKDRNGTINQSAARHFSVEATNPQARINSIAMDSASGRPVLAINLTSTDANLNYTRILATNSTGAVLNSTESGENGSYIVNLQVPYESQYIITANSYDNAGNTNLSIAVYNVDASASSQYFMNVISKRPVLAMGGFVLNLGIASLIVILLIIALWRHNRKGKKPKKSKVIMIDYKGN